MHTHTCRIYHHPSTGMTVYIMEWNNVSKILGSLLIGDNDEPGLINENRMILKNVTKNAEMF